MTASPAARRRAWILAGVFWTLIGMAFAGQLYISSAQLGRPITWQRSLIYSLSDWYVFALLSFLPIQLARRFGFDSPRWLGSLGVHLAASAFFSLAYVACRSLVGLWHGWPDPGMTSIRTTLPALFVKTWHFNLLMYWVIVSVTHAFLYYQKFQERHLHAVELERSLAQAKLEALQMQLNPHFLFNSLGAIAELMHRDVNAADRMLTRLSELLRTALDSSRSHEVNLRQELAFLRRYLEIEQTRFGDRLAVSFDVAPELMEARVPNLILQPLIENAIKHGIEPMARPGVVAIAARRDGDVLEVRVTDNGRGLPAVPPKREGIGLSNSRARLRELHGDRAVLELTSPPQGGVIAMVRIPDAWPAAGPKKTQ